MTNTSAPIPLGDEARALLAEGSSRPVLLQGAIIVSMDPQIGDLERGDVLLRGSEIVAAGADLSQDERAEGAAVIDCRGLILAPGFHDTHRHAWQGGLRRLMPDYDLTRYMTAMHFGMAHYFRPEDIYAGNVATSLAAIDAGITTIMDFSHNSRSGAHSDAAIAAFDDTRLRAVHASAAPVAGEWERNWPHDLERLAASLPGSGRVSLRMALFPPVWGAIPDYVALSEKNISLARELGLQISVDAVIGDEASEVLERLSSAPGALGPDITYIHCTDLTDDAWRIIAGTGGTVSLSPASDAQFGLGTGLTPVQKCLDCAVEPTLSGDTELSLPHDMFSQMRALLMIQRMNVFTRRVQGDEQAPPLLVSRDAFRMATISGARANGLGEVSGSISPGKKADIIAIHTADVNMLPVNNVYGSLVQGADSRNIEFVLIDGYPVKWQRQVQTFDIGEADRLARASREYVLASSGFSGGIFD